MWRGVRWVFNTTSRGKSFKNNISVGFSLFWTYLWVAFYETDWDLSWIHNQTQSVFSSLCSMRIYDSEVMSVYLIDWYQNVRPRAMPFHELSFKSSTWRAFYAHDTWFDWLSENALRLHSWAFYHWAVAFESEWKHCMEFITAQCWKNASVQVSVRMNSALTTRF